MSNDIIDYNTFNVNFLTFSDPEKTQLSNGKSIRLAKVRYNNNGVYVQTPKMNVLTVNKDYIELEFPKDAPTFYDNIFVALDYNNIHACHKNSVRWFKGKQVSLENIQNVYKTPILPQRYLESPPRVRFNLQKTNNLTGKTNKITTTIYNQLKKKTKFSELSAGDTIVSIIELKGLSFTQDSFTPIWDVIQIKLTRHKEKLDGYSIRDSDSDSQSKKDIDMYSIAPNLPDDIVYNKKKRSESSGTRIETPAYYTSEPETQESIKLPFFTTNMYSDPEPDPDVFDW